MTGAADGVLVWCRFTEELDAAACERLRACLSADEIERHDRLRVPADRRDYAAAHALLREMLSHMEARSPREWRFERTTHGKPLLPTDLAGSPPCRFSVTHTRGLVACAAARGREVGIDAERLTRSIDVESVAAQACSADERAQLAETVDDHGYLERFIELWTLKEAFVKAQGRGLAMPLDAVSFDLRAPGTIAPAITGEPAGRWHFAVLAPGHDARVALAVESGGTPRAATWVAAQAIAGLSRNGAASIPIVRSSAAVHPRNGPPA